MKKVMPLPEPWQATEESPHGTALPGARDVMLHAEESPKAAPAAGEPDAASSRAAAAGGEGLADLPLPGAEDAPAAPAPGTARTDAASCAAAGQCPLARIPDSAWKALFHRPFRKRHPIIFWGLVLLLLIGVGSFAALDEEDFEGSDRLALLEIRGTIDDIRPQLEWLDKLAQRSDVKGLLVRVDSPGGSAAASQELYEVVAAFGKRMPVAVYMGSTAASGGLMVSMAGKRIFANASTVTGSIGVRMDIPQIRQLLDKIGVGQETLTTGPYKDAGSMLRPLSREDREYFEALLKDMHDIFVEIVANGRNMPEAKVRELASGKVFTGREALKLGLVDELGTQADALRWLAEQADVPVSRKLLRRPREIDWWREPLESLLRLVPGAQSVSGGGSPAFLYQM